MYYPFLKIDKPGQYLGLNYDSYQDILANKVQTIATGPRSRDFVDLYFAYQKEKFSIEDLIKLSRAKFDWPIDRLQFAAQLTKAKDLLDFPRFLLPFDQGDYFRFYDFLIEELKEKIIKV